MSKTRMPVSASCLITDRTYVLGISDATSRKRRQSQTAPAISTMDVPIQNPPEWAELVPSLPGENDGRPKWAAVDVIGASVGADSVTVPSWGDEAQAESSHATTRANIPNNADRFLTKPNLAMAELHATSGIRGLMRKEGATKKFCAEREARV